MTLQELTGYEAGIVIYNGDGFRPEAVVCNWSAVQGYPRIDPLGLTVLGFGEEIPEVEPMEINDIIELLNQTDIVFCNGETVPDHGLLWKVTEDITVICPDGWC